jgi:hypothetical protein
MRTSMYKWMLAVGMTVSSAAGAETIVKPLVEVGSEARYDSEPYLDGHSEFFSKISPKLGARLASETLKLEGWYAADVLYKAERHDTAIDHRAAIKFSDQATRRLQLHGDLGFWRVEDPTSLPRVGVANVKVPIFYGTTGLGLSYRLSPRWTLVVDDKQEVAKIQLNNLPLSLTQTPSAGLKYQLGHNDELSSTYRYQAFLAMPSLVAQTHAALLGVSHKFSHTWTGYVRGGPLAFIKGAAGKRIGDDALVAVGEGGLVHTGQYSELDFVAGHDLVGSVGYATAVWADYVQAEFAIHPKQKLKLFIGAGAFRNGAAPDKAVDITGYTLGGGGSYAITHELEVALAGQRLQQSAQYDVAAQAVQLNRNIVGVRLNYTPEFSPKGL